MSNMGGVMPFSFYTRPSSLDIFSLSIYQNYCVTNSVLCIIPPLPPPKKIIKILSVLSHRLLSQFIPFIPLGNPILYYKVTNCSPYFSYLDLCTLPEIIQKSRLPTSNIPLNCNLQEIHCFY